MIWKALSSGVLGQPARPRLKDNSPRHFIASCGSLPVAPVRGLGVLLPRVGRACPSAPRRQCSTLANATLYSALTGQTIELPLDGAAYEKKLQQLIAESKFEKKVVEAKAEDFSKSFNR